MAQLSTHEMWYGRKAPPPEVVRLRAGWLEAEFENGDLRYIRLGQEELVRRIYVAVRDPNWNTIPGQLSHVHIEQGVDHFRIEYEAYHQAAPIAFRWRASFTGSPEGVITAAMDGTAEADFRYCRIGFCVLHPIAGIAGRRYSALTQHGPIRGELPKSVAAQVIVDGFEAPIFPPCSALTIQLDHGRQLHTVFEGDLFEMEDQRNWTDGSFKTYCTPLSLGYPHQARAGQEFHQKIVLQVEGAQKAQVSPQTAGDGLIELHVAEDAGASLPSLGFELPESVPALSAREIDLLSGLRPDHLKASLHLGDPVWETELSRAAQQADALQSPLELAVFLNEQPEPALARLAQALEGVPVARVLVFDERSAAQETTSARVMHLARGLLSRALPGVPLYGGTNGNFAELNRQPPDIASMDGVAYTLNPQVHAFDERSLVEAIEAQRDTVETARSFSGKLPVAISSVTLRPPFNQAAKEAEAQVEPDRLPPAVDPRQMSLFAAAWTAGSIASLGLGGADSITYYQTIGWQGLIERESGNPLPDQFPSFPGMVFPVYWLFDFLAGAKGANLRQLECEQPLRVGGLVLQKGAHGWLALCNYQAHDQSIRVQAIPNGTGWLRRLNQESMAAAAGDPVSFRSRTKPVTIRNQSLQLELRPFETVFVAYDGSD